MVYGLSQFVSVPQCDDDDYKIADDLYRIVFATQDEDTRIVMLHDLALAIACYSRTGDVAPLVHFSSSIRTTANLLTDHQYVHHVKEADSRPLGKPVDVKDAVADFRARYRSK